MKNFICFLVITFIVEVQGNCQKAPYTNVNIASPTAASINKFEDIPVSYHTGIPNISIPIYTVNEGPLSLPISLNYHGGGVKVMEPAGWVGTGWALNAGGVISRTIRGAADENGSSNSLKGHFSNYGFSNYLTYMGAASCDGSHVDNNDVGFANGIIDGEPDLFTFSFNGYSGKFYFSDDRTPVIIDGQDIKIEYYYPKDTASSYTAYSANIQGFILTVTNGDRYYFGINAGDSKNGISPVEITFPYSDDNENITERIFSSWYLRKIVSADDVFTINLTYQAESYSYYTLSMFPVDAGLPVSADEYKLVKTFVDGVRLDQVVFSNGSVSFSPSVALRTDLGNGLNSGVVALQTDAANTEAKSLAAISIKNNSGFCKSFKLFYSYFIDNSLTPLSGSLSYYSNIQTDKYRLKLDSLREQSCNDVIINPPYKFNYYYNFLPRRLSFAQDHWGFYNGAVNSTLIPTYSINTYNFMKGANRESKWPEMRSGVLSGLTYPTGGNDTFDFEANTTWVNATRYSPADATSYSVGYDGNPYHNYPNTALSANHYQVVINNHTCPSGQSGCSATVQVIGSNGALFSSVTAAENQSTTAIIVVPAGNYTIALSRSAVQSGSGAEARFTEIVSTLYQANAIVGGLRIKTLTRNDGISSLNNSVTSYNYDDHSQSSGILYSRPSYVQVLRNDIVARFGYSPECGSATVNVTPNGCSGPETIPNSQKYFKSPCAIVPMASTQGNHIGYKQITVSQSGNGSSVYRYYGSNKWDNIISDVAIKNVNPQTCNLSIPAMPANPLAFEYQRGELYYEGHLNQSGQRVKETYYYYQFDSTKISTPALNEKFIMAALLANTYELRGYWKKQLNTLTNEYTEGGTIISTTDTTFFESAFHHQPTRKGTRNSANELKSQKFKYAADFRIPVCEAISDCSAAYYTACSSCDADMNTSTANCVTLSCKYRAYITNLQCRANARINYINCRKINFTNQANTFKTNHDNAKATADVQLKPILELQDKSMITPIEITTWKNGRLTEATYTKYDYSANPAMKVYPSKIQKINLSAPLTDYTSSSNNGTILSKDSRYSDEVAYDFLLGNVASVLPKSGVRTSYLWGYSNQLPIAKCVNAIVTDIAYTSFEENSKGNWTFTGMPLTDYNPPSGSKSYSLSAANITKTSLTASQAYILSYWSRSGSQTISNAVLTATGAKVNGWTYYEYKITNAASVSIGGSGIIDELRLYPVGTQMTTYTYEPFIGMISQGDINNDITYYEYDALNRLKIIRDQQRNVLKKYCYNYAGQPETCAVTPVAVALTSVNPGLIAGFIATYTNINTGATTVYNISSAGAASQGLQYVSGSTPLTSGNYNLTIAKSGNIALYTFRAGCGSISTSGSVGFFYNISISPGSCNQISLLNLQ